MAWVGGGGLSNLCGGGPHDSTPHDSTQGWAQQRSTVHQLSLPRTYKHNCTFKWVKISPGTALVDGIVEERSLLERNVENIALLEGIFKQKVQLQEN